jgi:hypothetical protein
LSTAEDARSPAAARLAAGRRFERALLRSVGAALLIAMFPLQGHARNPAGVASNDQTQADSGDRTPIAIVPCRRVRVAVPSQGLFGEPPSGLLAASGLKGTAQQGANAEQRCLSALAYVLSPPPATRGVLPRYLPTISPKDAQPIPPVAAATPLPRPAWRQAGRVRRSQGHQGRRRQGAQRLLAQLRRPLHVQHVGSSRHERSARRLRFHRHRLCPRRCGGGPGVMAPRRRPQLRPKVHSTNPIERLHGEIKRRTEVVGIFPNEDAIVRLVGAILLEQSEKWAVQRARHMTLENHRAFERSSNRRPPGYHRSTCPALAGEWREHNSATPSRGTRSARASRSFLLLGSAICV